MEKDKLKNQLPSNLLGISEKCMAVALALVGIVAVGQPASAALPSADAAPTAIVSQVNPAATESGAILLVQADPTVGQQVAQHESHSSHASHASHYSSR